MIVGFTGSRTGFKPSHSPEFARIINKLKATTFIHGACIGSDQDAVEWIKMYWMVRRCWIVAYPGVSTRNQDRSCQSQKAIELSDEVMPEMGHFSRNRLIVERCEVLVAVTNYYSREEPEYGSGGGTFYSIQYAEKVKKPTYIIWADGTVSERNFA